jgi:hypothetical protein
MTLEQTTKRMLAAAQAEDLLALVGALREREIAFATLASIPPSLDLRDAVEASIAAGEEARRAIRAIKLRIRKITWRLASIEHAFLRVLLPGKHQIDCKG